MEAELLPSFPPSAHLSGLPLVSVCSYCSFIAHLHPDTQSQHGLGPVRQLSCLLPSPHSFTAISFLLTHVFFMFFFFVLFHRLTFLPNWPSSLITTLTQPCQHHFFLFHAMISRLPVPLTPLSSLSSFLCRTMTLESSPP